MPSHTDQTTQNPEGIKFRTDLSFNFGPCEYLTGDKGAQS